MDGGRPLGRFRFDLLIAGHTNLDRFLRVERLPGTDRTVPVKEVELRLGGTAANIALAGSAARLRCLLASLVGRDLPQAYRRRLRRAGIDLRLFRTLRTGRTPCCYIVEQRDGQQVTMIDQGSMAGPYGPAVPLALLRETAWVHLTTGPPEGQLRLLAAARSAGRPVAVDPAQEVRYRWSRAELTRLLAGSELLFGNRAEIDEILRILRLRGLRELLERVPLVVRTDGARGAEAFSRTGRARAPSRARQRGRIVGAGDAFRGGFYSGWLRGVELPGCLEAGNLAASAWIRSSGELGEERARRSAG